jgi:hypothetical protein
MSVNSISPSQPAQATQALKKDDVATARKQTEIRDEDKVKSRKDAADQYSQARDVHLQKATETKASINTNGQKVGSLINIAA